ncbi:hypothetical protein H0H87_011532, partial [Tephrocybe sp. NHM501043]
MAMIRALPDDYSAFVSSLLLKDSLDKAAITQAFVTEETQCQRHANDAAAAAIAMSAALAKANCDFCSLSGYIQADCFKYQAAQQQAKQNTKQQAKACFNKGKRHQEQANAADNTSKDDKSENGTEFAGNA